jgi:hypothetical protein
MAAKNAHMSLLFSPPRSNIIGDIIAVTRRNAQDGNTFSAREVFFANLSLVGNSLCDT